MYRPVSQEWMKAVATNAAWLQEDRGVSLSVWCVTKEFFLICSKYHGIYAGFN